VGKTEAALPNKTGKSDNHRNSEYSAFLPLIAEVHKIPVGSSSLKLDSFFRFGDAARLANKGPISRKGRQ
jgi:hypothetical protein